MADNDQAAINEDAEWFLSPQASFPQTSLFSFATLSAVIGLFFEQAVLKLKHVAEMNFSKAERGADAELQIDQDARKEVNKLDSPDWADYLQYGTYEFSLKPAKSRRET